MPLRELKRLSDAETLLLWRRREKLNQHEAATYLGISRDMYSRYERGLDDRAPRRGVKVVKDHEVCFLYRRRSNKTQEEIAKDMGCCRRWLNLMERGLAPCGALIEYWEV